MKSCHPREQGKIPSPEEGIGPAASLRSPWGTALRDLVSCPWTEEMLEPSGCALWCTHPLLLSLWPLAPPGFPVRTW